MPREADTVEAGTHETGTAHEAGTELLAEDLEHILGPEVGSLDQGPALAVLSSASGVATRIREADSWRNAAVVTEEPPPPAGFGQSAPRADPQPLPPAYPQQAYPQQ
jgi:hypothetical protein